MSGARYEHCVRTAQMAARMARLFKMDPAEAYTAGLLHDCARDLPPTELLRQAIKNNQKLSKILKNNPILLHGNISAIIAKKEFGITEQRILRAISQHIVGSPRMSKLAKIIFVADYIEPSRSFPAAKNIRDIIFKSTTKNKTRLLAQAVKLKAQTSLNYAAEKNWQIHPVLVKLAKRKI